MSTALRAIFLVPLCILLLCVFSTTAYAVEEQDDGDGNLLCPSVPSLYVYVKGIGYGEKIGDKVSLTIFRDGQTLSLNAKLKEAPNE